MIICHLSNRLIGIFTFRVASLGDARRFLERGGQKNWRTGRPMRTEKEAGTTRRAEVRSLAQTRAYRWCSAKFETKSTNILMTNNQSD